MRVPCTRQSVWVRDSRRLTVQHTPQRRSRNPWIGRLLPRDHIPLWKRGAHSGQCVSRTRAWCPHTRWIITYPNLRSCPGLVFRFSFELSTARWLHLHHPSSLNMPSTQFKRLGQALKIVIPFTCSSPGPASAKVRASNSFLS